MGFYYDHIVPHLVNLAMRNRLLKAYRERVVGLAQGRVLEIGIGSGMNLPFYTSRTTEILGLEPHPKLLEMASPKTSRDRATLIEGLRNQFHWIAQAWIRFWLPGPCAAFLILPGRSRRCTGSLSLVDSCCS